MSPDFRSLPLEFPEFWRIQLPQSPSRRCHSGLEAHCIQNPMASAMGYARPPHPGLKCALGWQR